MPVTADLSVFVRKLYLSECFDSAWTDEALKVNNAAW
jgi:hypothetical protein